MASTAATTATTPTVQRLRIGALLALLLLVHGEYSRALQVGQAISPEL